MWAQNLPRQVVSLLLDFTDKLTESVKPYLVTDITVMHTNNSFLLQVFTVFPVAPTGYFLTHFMKQIERTR